MKKNNIKNVIKGIALLAILVPVDLSAQQMQGRRGTAEERAKSQTEMMQNQFGLSKDQLPKVNAINLKYTKEMEVIITNKDMPDKREAMNKMSANKDADLKKVFTAEQFQKLQTMEQQRRQMIQNRMQNRPQGMQAAPPPGGATPPGMSSGK